jgi:hypothetical protein
MPTRHRSIFNPAYKQPFKLALLSTLALIAPSAHAQDQADTGKRPAAAGRVVRAFDFEEQDFNPLPVPLGWYRGQEDPAIPRIRPGFPLWNHAALDYTSPAVSGVGTVKLPVQGGSASLILRRGEINIFPNADYLISTHIRTENLTHAKARVYAKLLDQKGNEIEGAHAASQLTSTDGSWTQISFEIEGVYPNAAFIQLELQLLQPKQQQEAQFVKPFEVWEEDFTGAAWFDNLIIAQLPRLELTTGTPGNIVESASTPPLQILVRDLTGDDITARITVYDVHGHKIDTQLLADGSRRVRSDWTPDLPGFGWYRAMLEIVVNDQLVGIRTLDFIWTAPVESKPNSGMFSIHTKLTNPKVAGSAHALIQGSGVTSASVEAWTLNTTKQDTNLDSPTMQAINRLVLMGIDLGVVIAEIPEQLAAKLAVDPDEVLPVFAGPSSAWIPWGAPMFDQFGQAINTWRFGDHPTQENTQTLNAQLDKINAALTGYVPGPMLVTPWAIDRPIEQQIVRPNQQLLLIDNNTTTADTMSIVVDDWAQWANASSANASSNPPELAMMLSPMHASKEWSGVQVWSSVGTFARKAIAFWWAASDTGLGNDRFKLELKDAWWVTPGKRGQVMPAPELVVWNTLATHLGSRQAIEELHLIPGVRMLVAGPKLTEESTPDNSGALILWLDQPTIEPVILNLPLSTSPVYQYDVFNNQTTIELQRIGDLELPMHRIAVGRSPTIITGVNTQLIRFLTSLNLTPNTLQARAGIHKHELHFTNPWPSTIRGRIYIVEPGGYTDTLENIDRSWEINPRVIPFVLDAHETRAVPIDIAYSLGELAGEKALTFDIELEADKDYPLMRIERTITLGLDGVDMQLTARRGPDGVTIIGVHVTNQLDSNQDFEVVAIPPNESRLRRSINAIKPGERVTREFAFTNTQSGDEVIVALFLRQSDVRLNKAVTVP